MGSEDVEIVPRDDVAPQAGIRACNHAQIHRHNAIANHSRKGCVPVANVHVVGLCQDRNARFRIDQRIEVAGPLDTCQWLQYRGIHNAEKNGGGADAERKGEDRNGAKAFVDAQAPDGQAEFEEDSVHDEWLAS